jgi:antitoxin FitA
MGKMIQIRNVPPELHRRLKARAAQTGMTLSDFLLEEARRAVERPTAAELRERLLRRRRVALEESPAEAVRREREER